MAAPARGRESERYTDGPIQGTGATARVAQWQPIRPGAVPHTIDSTAAAGARLTTTTTGPSVSPDTPPVWPAGGLCLRPARSGDASPLPLCSILVDAPWVAEGKGTHQGANHSTRNSPVEVLMVESKFEESSSATTPPSEYKAWPRTAQNAKSSRPAITGFIARFLSDCGREPRG